MTEKSNNNNNNEVNSPKEDKWADMSGDSSVVPHTQMFL